MDIWTKNRPIATNHKHMSTEKKDVFGLRSHCGTSKIKVRNEKKG